MPMQSEPSHSTLQSCVTNEPVTVKHLMPWAEAQGCEISNVKSVQNGLKWRLLCDVNGQPSRGRGTFTAEGKSGEGKARVSVAMGARSLAIVTHWDARRVGPCSENSVSDQPRRLGTEEE